MTRFAFILLCLWGAFASRGADWASPARFRVWLTVATDGRARSHSPAAVTLDFQQMLRDTGVAEDFDEHTVEVFPQTGAKAGPRVAYRLEKLFGATETTLHFVVPNEAQSNFAVYFDTAKSRWGNPRRYHGLIGDGDRFVQEFGRREIAASHFDCFVDFDADGDLDLFQGGVEPYVYCFENVGRNRLVERGRLASGGKVFKLPCSRANRSWVTVAFFDIDADGDQDFFPSFGDGPDAGKIIFYRNTTREHGGPWTLNSVPPASSRATGTQNTETMSRAKRAGIIDAKARQDAGGTPAITSAATSARTPRPCSKKPNRSRSAPNA